jgi:TonB-linked SusC/RagA family outer membrane protein
MKKNNYSLISMIKLIWKSKLLKAMRLTLFVIVMSVVQIFAATTYSQETRLSLNLKNTSIRNVLEQIENRTEFYFIYNAKAIDVDKKVSVEFENKSISEILDKLFEGTNVMYKIDKRQIALSTNSVINNIQQNISISGKVTDSSGSPLPGVTVLVKGTSLGTITDANGNYSFPNVSGDATLVFSFVGMRAQEIAVAGKNMISVVLQEETIGIEEVVAIGYGTRAKGAVTGAVSTVRSEVFESRPVTNSLDALQGNIPGVTITKGSGRPGAEGFDLQIRGYSSLNGNTPLILVDGVPENLSTVNTNDIAEITVLKDAAAAIYGARAADGVILITTKKGGKGIPTVSYSINYAIKTPQFLCKSVNTLQLAEMLNEAAVNIGHAGISPDVFEKIKANAPPDNIDSQETTWHWIFGKQPNFYQYTDWMKVLFGNSEQQIHNLSISGGGENNTYLVSVGYNKNKGLINFGKNEFDRYNLRLNYDFKLFGCLNIETKTSFINTVRKEPSQLATGLSWGPRHHPFVPVYNSVGEFYAYQGVQSVPKTLVEGGEFCDNGSQLTANIKGDLQIMKGLKLVTQASATLNYFNITTTNRTFTDNDWLNKVTGIRNNPNSASFSNGKNIRRNFTGYLDYTQEFGPDHRINLMAGASHEENQYESQRTNGYNYPTNDLFTLNLADRSQVAYANFTGALNDWALRSYFTRFSYSFRNKAFLDLTTRADGSSKFAPEERWSTVYPSVLFAYTLSEEKFVKSLNAFDLLKLRLSWGKTGNQDISALGLYDYMQLITLGGTNVLGSPNVGLPGATPQIASESRTWETIQTKNIGIDLATLRSRLSLSFDYYIKTNENMLVQVATAATFGGTPPTQNQGKLETKGFDAFITWKDKIKDFEYSVSFQLSDSKNKLVELKNTDNYTIGLNKAREGYSMFSWFGMDYAGIIKTQEQLDEYKKLKGVPAKIALGDVMFRDVDGDGEITYYGDKTKGTTGDMVYLGNLLPRYTFSSTINLKYKNFDCQFFLQGVGKRTTMYEGIHYQPFSSIWWDPVEYFYEKTWTPDRPDTKFPRIIPGGVGYDELKNWDYRVSAMRMDDVSYLRVKLITLGYTLPSPVLSKIRMKGARIYVSGQDLFTVSKGTREGAYDPEDSGRSEATYPFNKVYSIGLDVKF